MSRELRKFLFVFIALMTIFVLIISIITLFVTEHYIIGACVALPSLSAFIAAVESDILDRLANKIYGNM
jgi:hypothetical protein